VTLEEEIGSQRYLYLTNITEPEENSLRLVIEAAHTNGPEHPIDPSLPSLGNATSIIADETTPAWEVVFHGYVAFVVFDESYALPAHEDEVWSGANLFRTYSKSRFFDYVRSCSFADDDHPGALRHYEIICLNHVVNIVTWYDPEITRIRWRLSPN
jgi:hypothetical protein